jgi:ribosomal protein S18 acetylase RimI-like enzyme
VQHHLRHGALRFEDDAFQHIRSLHPKDRESHFCLATRPDDLIEVVGMIHYRVTCDDLYFEYIRVRKAYRLRDVARRMITEVVTHPACIGLRRIHWAAGEKGSAALIQHLERLRSHVQGLSGTTFELTVVHTPGPKS